MNDSCQNQSLDTSHEPSRCPLICGRRQFMKYGLGVFASLWGAMTLYPVYRYLDSAHSEEQTAVTSVSAGKPSDLPKGTAKNFKFGSQPALIIHADDDQFYAYNAVCTHLGCTVQYDAKQHQILCACHGGVYEAVSGKNIAGPPPKPLTPLKVQQSNNELIVSKSDASKDHS